MKVEHITLGGTVVIRDTNDILNITRLVFNPIRMSYESKTVILPKLPFKIKITASDEGAAFDIMKGEELVITNFCCFEEKYSNDVLANIYKLSDMYNKAGWKVAVIEPVTPQWLYSAIINPLAVKPEDISLAGEVELYIYEQLYLAKKLPD